jgi:5-methylcytosine-specific restriction endonuclease McrA
MDNAPPTTQRISEIHRWDVDGRLELAPPFQRKPVWSPKSKSYLIDTILNGLPVPEIYLQIRTDKEGNTKYVVVDGQQRIRAILEFLNKEFAVSKEDNKEYGGKEFDQLPDGVKTDFWNYGLVVRELKNVRDKDIREIFQRLNKNVMPLNEQELRHAAYAGKFHNLVYSLVEDEYWRDTKIVNSGEIRRMGDAAFVSELLKALISGLDARNDEVMDRFYQQYDEVFEQEDEVKQKFQRTRNKIDEIFGDDLVSSRWHYKAEYYSLFFALSHLLDEYHLAPEKYAEVKSLLLQFSKEVDSAILAKEDMANMHFQTPYVIDFATKVIAQTTHKKQRTERDAVIRKLIIPFLTIKDSRRLFNEEEKRAIWDSSKSKKCAICGKVVSRFEEYEPHHSVPHAKGGRTEIGNAQVTHSRCNKSKGAR